MKLLGAALAIATLFGAMSSVSARTAGQAPPSIANPVRAGKTLDETKALVDISKYKDWGGFQQMGALNVEGMYRLVAANRRPN
jgi:hypothetical protein